MYHEGKVPDPMEISAAMRRHRKGIQPEGLLKGVCDMGWNEQDFVLTADAQFNGAPVDHVSDLEDFVSLFGSFASQYQVVVSPELGSIIATRRNHEPIDSRWDVAMIRHHDEQIVGFPMEFYQSQIQKPNFYIDFKDRINEFMHIVRSSPGVINWVYDQAFFDLHNHGVDLESAIESRTIEAFGNLDVEMLGMVSAYLRQMPRRAIMLFDIEAVDPNPGKILKEPRWFFEWMEIPFTAIRDCLQSYGIETLTVCSGKGYHIIASVPLYSNGSISSAMLNVMSIGGVVQAETLDRLVTVYPERGKVVPCPPLTQRAYQGINKLIQFVAVNLLDDMRGAMAASGFPPHIGITDNFQNQISIDLTGGTRQVEMGCFGSVASIYNKKRDPVIVRIPRSRGNTEFFGGDIGWMLHTRGDLEAASAHLSYTGGWIPESIAGFDRLVAAYEESRMKRELHDPCEHLLDPGLISGLINFNYGDIRARVPEINGHIDQAQPRFLTPGDLDFVYHKMLERGYTIDDMRHLTYAVYCDSVKGVHIEPYYSKAEWARWPILLMGELFKG